MTSAQVEIDAQPTFWAKRVKAKDLAANLGVKHPTWSVERVDLFPDPTKVNKAPCSFKRVWYEWYSKQIKLRELLSIPIRENVRVLVKDNKRSWKGYISTHDRETPYQGGHYIVAVMPKSGHTFEAGRAYVE